MCTPVIYPTSNALALALMTPYQRVHSQLKPVLDRWGNGYLLRVSPSGSYAKGTAVEGSSDVDIFCSVSSSVPDTLPQVFSTLFNALNAAGFAPSRQNVSLGIQVGSLSVDVTPGKRRDAYGNDHSLFSTKTGNWIKTDIERQIAFVKSSGRLEEIKWLKRWRNSLSLCWPSYHLELFTISALRFRPTNQTVKNVAHVLERLCVDLNTIRLIDPANSNNDVSSTMSPGERFVLSYCAGQKLPQLRAFAE